MPEETKDTQPNAASKGDTSPNAALPSGKKFPRWLAFALFGALIVIGGLSGYGSGMGKRYAAQKTQDAAQMQEQMRLGMQAMNVGQYEVAKQHLEYILEQDPGFPGAQEAYADLLMRMQTSPTPTSTQTPTITPTADLRSAEEQFDHAQELLNASDWNGALTSLDSLRKLAPTYRSAEVDGMYFTALRMRGFLKISNTDCKQINLEGGIYDLTLAERFGPLDATAVSLRTYARLYITAASFWDQDWVQAQTYFFQVMSALPNLSDSSCQSASERWVYATLKYAAQLDATGDSCGASEQYAAAFAVTDAQNQPFYGTATALYNDCHPYVPPPPTATETPTGEAPVEPPTDTPGP